MSKQTFRVYLFLFSTILLSACDLSRTISATDTPSLLSTIRLSGSPTLALSSTSTIIPETISTPTPLPILPTVTDWSIFTNPSGVSIEYPANWQIKTRTDYDNPLFTLDTTSAVSSYYWIYLNVFDRPIEEQRITDPHAWESTDYSYEILWEKPIILDSLSGTEVVVNHYKTDENQSGGKIQLMAVLYSETYQLDIRLSTSFDKETADLALEEGFDAVIAEKFTVFEHMLQSIRIEPSVAVVPYPAPVGCTPILCPTATVTPEPTTPSRLDIVEIDHHSLQSILEAVKYAFATGDVRVFEQLAGEKVRIGLAFSDGPGQVLSKQEFVEAMSLRLPSRPACLSYESNFGVIDALSIYTTGWEPLWTLDNGIGSRHLILSFTNQDTEDRGLYLRSIAVYEGESPYMFGLPCE
jgi:hypothetical protein